MIFESTFGSITLPEESLHSWLFKRFSDNGDKVALVDGLSGDEFTYNDLITISQKVASGLVKLGLRKGDVLSIYSDNTVECIFIFFGTLAAGGTVGTVNPNYTEYEVINHLNLSGSRFVYCAANLIHKCVSVRSRTKIQTIISQQITHVPNLNNCIPFDELINDDGSFWPQLDKMLIRPKEDIAVILFSSGTTGLPKGVMLSHYNLLSNRLQILQVMQIQENTSVKRETSEQTVVLVVMPFYHSYGLISISLGALSRCAKLVILPKFEPRTFFSSIEKYKVNLVQIVPPIAAFISESPLIKQYDVSSIRKILCSAAPLAKNIELKLRTLLNIPNIRQTYGLTEASPSVTQHNPHLADAAGSCGALLPATQAKIIDVHTGRCLGPNEKGEIYIKGPQLMVGYLNNERATKDSFDSNRFYKTGDIGYFDKEQNLYVVDRIKELIKVKGFQVAPAELEAILITHAAVEDVGVVGIEDNRAGELPRAYVVSNKQYNVTADELKNYVAEKLVSYKHLNGGVIFVDAIPRLPSGKIIRRKLKEMNKVKSNL